MKSRPIGWLCAAGLLVWSATTAQAQESHFAVVDISKVPHNEKVVADLERQVVRLKAGAKTLDDANMRRLLARGEGPVSAASRLTKEAEEARAAGDCATAVDRATQAEATTLSAVPLDDEREMLRAQYVVLVACHHELGHNAERDVAALRLRALVALLPPKLPQDVWDRYVAGAALPAATVELHVDSDPPNAQIQINYHGDGVTPRTLKVPKGTVYVEVQKDGYLKAFRKVEIGNAPTRTAFRLIERTHDRVDQALASMNLLRRTDPGQTPSVKTLAQLAQLTRSDSLVVMSMQAPDRVQIWFFDAERGAMSNQTITSPVDPATGQVEALATRGSTAAAAPAPAAPTLAPALAPSAAPPAPSAAALERGAGLPEAQARQQQAIPIRRRAKSSAPWWSWALAGLIGAGLVTFVILDQPRQQSTLAIRANWTPPAQ
jgi:hypothetical protein